MAEMLHNTYGADVVEGDWMRCMVWLYSFLCQADEKEKGFPNIHHQAKFELLSNVSCKFFKRIALVAIHCIKEPFGSHVISH